MYGPPVPTGKPIPGVFGGGDSTFFDRPPGLLYPGWVYGAVQSPRGAGRRAARPWSAPPVALPPPAPALDKPAPLEVEVRRPAGRRQALHRRGRGERVRARSATSATPHGRDGPTYSYDLRAEWAVDGLSRPHAKRSSAGPGRRSWSDFTNGRLRITGRSVMRSLRCPVRRLAQGRPAAHPGRPVAYANCYPKTSSSTTTPGSWTTRTWTTRSPTSSRWRAARCWRPTILALHRVGRNNPLAHHVLNVLIHLAATLTLYGLVRRALLLAAVRRPVRRPGPVPGVRRGPVVDAAPAPGAVRHVRHPARRVDGRAVLPAHPVMQRAMSPGREASTAPGADRLVRPRAWSVWCSGSGRRRFWSPPRARSCCSTASSWPGRSATWSAGGGCSTCSSSSPGAGSPPGTSAGPGRRGGARLRDGIVTPKQYALTETGVILYYLRICVWPRGLAIDYQSWPWGRRSADAMPEAAIVAGLLALTAVLLFWRPALGFVCCLVLPRPDPDVERPADRGRGVRAPAVPVAGVA